jgi:hypothetical protein
MEPRAKARGNSIVTYLNSYSYNLSLTAIHLAPLIFKNEKGEAKSGSFGTYTKRKHPNTTLALVYLATDANYRK